ncbi:MAG: RsmD family RNA methyltransferase [Pseudomonadota bacterium]
MLEKKIFRGSSDCLKSVDKKYAKYYDVRYNILSKFDDALITLNSIYSTKPESSCLDIAARISNPTVVDLFCGIGGLSIAAARYGKHVIAIDNSASELIALRHNADLYGVSEKIRTLRINLNPSKLSSLFDYGDSLIIDPPWNGDGKSKYLAKACFQFEDFGSLGIIISTLISTKLNKQIILCAPRNFDREKISECRREYHIFEHESEKREPFLSIEFPAS